MARLPATVALAARIEADLLPTLTAGDRLPPMRELATRYGAGPVTVHGAVRLLTRAGRLETRPGDGTFVAAPVRERAHDLGWQTTALGPARPAGDALAALLTRVDPDAVHLGSGYPDPSLYPRAGLRVAANRATRRPGAWERAPAAGLDDLRRWFADATGHGVRPHEVVIAPGGQAALSAAFRALQPAGAPVIVESPTWVGAMEAARGAGHTLVPVPTDADGVRPDALADALARSGARLVYLQPLYANPTGATLARSRRAAVLDAVRRAGAFLVEDDYARDLGHEAPSPPPLLADDDGHVVYVRSITKSTAPSLRIAAIIARGPAAARLQSARLVDELFTSRFLQEVALDLVANGPFTAHCAQLRRALHERSQALVRALAVLRLAPAVPVRGGYSAWVPLPEGTDEAAFVRAAAAAGVIVNGGRDWFPAEPTGAWIRMSVAGEPVDRIVEGVGRLAPALARA